MKTRIIYGLLSALFLGMYWLTWSGAVLFVGIIGAYLCVQLVRACFRRGSGYWGIIGIMAVAGVVGAVIRNYSPLLFTGQTALTTMELGPLNFYSALANFNILTLLVPVIFALLAYQVVKRGEASLILLLVWSVVILVIMLEYRRFAYYFAVNVALLTGWFIWFAWQRLVKQDTLKAVMVTALLCVAIAVPNIQQATASKNYHTPSDAWCDTLTWVKDNTPQGSIILSWWDYGYWIEHIADREAYATPSQEAGKITDTAHLFLSTFPSQGEVGSSLYHDYLILDYATTNKFKAITIWADSLVEKHSPEYYQSLLVRLYQGEPVGQYALVYRSEQEIEGIPEVKVFYKRIIIDGQ